MNQTASFGADFSSGTGMMSGGGLSFWPIIIIIVIGVVGVLIAYKAFFD